MSAESTKKGLSAEQVLGIINGGESAVFGASKKDLAKGTAGLYHANPEEFRKKVTTSLGLMIAQQLDALDYAIVYYRANPAKEETREEKLALLNRAIERAEKGAALAKESGSLTDAILYHDFCRDVQVASIAAIDAIGSGYENLLIAYRFAKEIAVSKEADEFANSLKESARKDFELRTKPYLKRIKDSDDSIAEASKRLEKFGRTEIKKADARLKEFRELLFGWYLDLAVNENTLTVDQASDILNTVL